MGGSQLETPTSAPKSQLLTATLTILEKSIERRIWAESIWSNGAVSEFTLKSHGGRLPVMFKLRFHCIEGVDLN